MHITFELNRVNTFPDNSLKPPFSVLLWPLEGQNLANMAKNTSILNTRPISIHTKFELDCVNAFSNNGRKPPFSVILWPLDGLNLANMAKQQINSEHSPNSPLSGRGGAVIASGIPCTQNEAIRTLGTLARWQPPARLRDTSRPVCCVLLLIAIMTVYLR